MAQTGTVSLSWLVLEAIANAEGVDPVDLDFTLQSHIDVDALDMLGTERGQEWSLRFSVDRHTVVVQSDWTISVDGHLY